jgi:hypothetical protein
MLSSVVNFPEVYDLITWDDIVDMSDTEEDEDEERPTAFARKKSHYDSSGRNGSRSSPGKKRKVLAPPKSASSGDGETGAKSWRKDASSSGSPSPVVSAPCLTPVTNDGN